jgi:hypothetical protein
MSNFYNFTPFDYRQSIVFCGGCGPFQEENNNKINRTATFFSPLFLRIL